MPARENKQPEYNRIKQLKKSFQNQKELENHIQSCRTLNNNKKFEKTNKTKKIEKTKKNKLKQRKQKKNKKKQFSEIIFCFFVVLCFLVFFLFFNLFNCFFRSLPFLQVSNSSVGNAVLTKMKVFHVCYVNSILFTAGFFLCLGTCLLRSWSLKSCICCAKFGFLSKGSFGVKTSVSIVRTERENGAVFKLSFVPSDPPMQGSCRRTLD